MVRHEIADRGLSNVRVLQANALATGLEAGSFDLVHERLVMVNEPSTTVVDKLLVQAWGRKPG